MAKRFSRKDYKVGDKTERTEDSVVVHRFIYDGRKFYVELSNGLFSVVEIVDGIR